VLGRKPAGYVQVNGRLVDAPAGEQTEGLVTCPIGKVPAGRGAVVVSSDVRVNINSSFPSGTSWIVDVNNASGTATQFSVKDQCIRQPRLYQVVGVNDLQAPAHIQAFGGADCPTGTVVLGGGAILDTNDLEVNLSTTVPFADGSGWGNEVSNDTGLQTSFKAFAICAKRPGVGYAVVTGQAASNSAFSQNSAFATCPGTAVPLSGGIVSFTGDPRVNLNSLRPEAHSFTSFENNNPAFPVNIQTKAVCGGS
jgi:hypothetical protein